MSRIPASQPAPSKYHHVVFIGGEIPRIWSWDSSHEDLKPTKVFKLGNDHYCSYCGEAAYPIQANMYKRPSFSWEERFSEEYYYRTTGHTCICDGAESEKEYNEKLKDLEEKHRQEIQELTTAYSSRMASDVNKKSDLICSFIKGCVGNYGFERVSEQLGCVDVEGKDQSS